MPTDATRRVEMMMTLTLTLTPTMGMTDKTGGMMDVTDVEATLGCWEMGMGLGLAATMDAAPSLADVTGATTGMVPTGTTTDAESTLGCWGMQMEMEAAATATALTVAATGTDTDADAETAAEMEMEMGTAATATLMRTETSTLAERRSTTATPTPTPPTPTATLTTTTAPESDDPMMEEALMMMEPTPRPSPPASAPSTTASTFISPRTSHPPHTRTHTRTRTRTRTGRCRGFDRVERARFFPLSGLCGGGGFCGLRRIMDAIATAGGLRRRDGEVQWMSGLRCLDCDVQCMRLRAALHEDGGGGGVVMGRRLVDARRWSLVAGRWSTLDADCCSTTWGLGEWTATSDRFDDDVVTLGGRGLGRCDVERWPRPRLLRPRPRERHNSDSDGTTMAMVTARRRHDAVHERSRLPRVNGVGGCSSGAQQALASSVSKLVDLCYPPRRHRHPLSSHSAGARAMKLRVSSPSSRLARFLSSRLSPGQLRCV